MADALEESKMIKSPEKEHQEHNQVNEVRTFISKSNPSQISPSVRPSPRKQAHEYSQSITKPATQPTTLIKAVKKKKTLTSAKKRANAFTMLKEVTTVQKQAPLTLDNPRFQIGDQIKQHSLYKQITRAEKDTTFNTPSLGISLNQALNDPLIAGYMGTSLNSRRMSQETDNFLRKNQNFEESKGFHKRPQDYQIQVKEETIVESEQPSFDHKMYQIEEENSPETLITLIGVEESNIKKIGMNRTASKGGIGSLTERQSHLLQASNFSNTQTLMETANQASGPEMPRRTNMTTSEKMNKSMRFGTVDNRHIQDLPLSLGSSRLSLGNSQDRANSLNRLSNHTQMAPFLQKALLNSNQDLTNDLFTEKLQKLKALDKIDVSQNKITLIPYPELLNHSQTLTYLCLDNNQILDIAEDTLRHLTRLHTLKLRGNRLNKLPESIFSLSQLRVLDVSSNKLTSISAKVSLLRQLNWLNISGNHLEGLPNSLGYLEKLQSITSEFFVYLQDHSRSSNIQINSTGDPELDWITQHHQRQTMTKNGPDGRFEKLMRFMRLQSSVLSTFLDLVHEFQHVEGEYEMLDTQQVLLTEDSEQIQLQSDQSFDKFHCSSQGGMTVLLSEPEQPLTSSTLINFGKYLPRCKYNELVTVFRTLHPDYAPGSNTMLHTLIQNNHPHLLRQYVHGIQKIVKYSAIYLQSAEARETFKSQHAQQKTFRQLQLQINSKLKEAVNWVNERGMTPLEYVLQGMQNEIADVFMQLLAKYMELDCQIGQITSPRSEIRVIIPGNQQSNVAFTEQQSLNGNAKSPNRIHPIVTALTSGRFQLANKLIDIAFDYFVKRQAREFTKNRKDFLLKEPSVSQKSFASIVSNKLPDLHLQQSVLEINASFSLNAGEKDTGMTFLHHVFANFDLNSEKAGNLFRKMNTMHLRHGSTQQSSLPRNMSNACGQSPSEVTLGNPLTLQNLSFSAKKLPNVNSQASAIFAQNRPNEPGFYRMPQLIPQMKSPKIERLELNPLTHYFETPYELAIEHFQNQAVQFALNWNFTLLQNLTAQQEKQSLSKRTKREQTNSLTSLENSKRFCLTSEPSMKEFFDLMSQSNPRKLTPLHRTVINGNYNALKLMLDSPLFHQTHQFDEKLSKSIKSLTLIDIDAQDKFGRKPRDYAHKIVFISKLLQQAQCMQVWRQADLYSIKRQLDKLRQTKAVSKGKLATYDKLICHTSLSQRQQRKSYTVFTNQIIGGGLAGDMITISHNCLNACFLKSEQVEKQNYSIYINGNQQNSGRNSSVLSHERRLTKSFAGNTTTTFKHNTPFQNKTSQSIFSAEKRIGETPGITRQPIPMTLAKGMKKAKSMAQNNVSNKQDRDHNQKQFLNQAIQTQRKLMKVKNSTRLPRGNFGPVGANMSLSTNQKWLKGEKFGAQSHLGINTIDKKETDQIIIIARQASNDLESRYGKTQSVLSSRENRNLLQKTGKEPTVDDESSNNSLTLIEGKESQRLFSNEDCEKESQPPYDGIDKSKTEFQLRLQALQTSSGKKTMHRSQKEKKLDQSQLSIVMDQLTKIPTQLVSKKLCSTPAKNIYKVKTNEPMQITDLDVIQTSPNKAAETSVELTHDFNDSGSANSFTPLPSVQINYALEIKSFTNQQKKPYSQQLSTNQFKEQFDLIMDNQCDPVHILEQEDNEFSSRLGKPLKPHQKMHLLFQIVKSAKKTHKLQDAKDVFDFIQYEIGIQTTQTQSSRRLETGPHLKESKYPHVAAQPSGKKSDTRKSPLKATQGTQRAVPKSWHSNENIIFLKQEVSYLRCQLDLITKELVAVPSREKLFVSDAHNISAFCSGSLINTTPGVVLEQEMSATGTISQHYRNHMLTSQNPSMIVNTGTEVHTETVMLDVTHLTEADQEFSQDFDENFNTVRQRNKKKSVMVRPSEMLGNKTDKSSTNKDQAQQSRLEMLLNKGSKTQKILMSKKRKNLKELDESMQEHAKQQRENLDTDEGSAKVNQPLISAEVQSFSDRLSQHRDSNPQNKIQFSSQRVVKQKSLLEMAARSIPKSKEAASAATVQSKNNKPKLKYAAFAQINLSSFDFKSRHLSISQQEKKEPFQEKSRSVIGIQKSQTLTANGLKESYRPNSRIDSEIDTRSLNVGRSDFNQESQETLQIVSTEERQFEKKFFSIQEESSIEPIKLSRFKKSLIQSSDNIKFIPGINGIKSIPVSSNRKAPGGKKTLKNIGGHVTQQKIGLKVLNDQKLRLNIGNPPMLKSDSDQTSSISMTSKTPSKIGHPSQLTSASINLPQTTKNANPTSYKGLKGANMVVKSIQNNYIQPKVTRTERPNFQILSRQQKEKLVYSRNPALPQTAQYTSTAPTKTLDAVPEKLKIKPHHRLLKDLIDNNSLSRGKNDNK